MEKFIGLDAGSVSVKLAVLDSQLNILQTRYVRHKGMPLTVALELLNDAGPAVSLNITGSAGKLIASAFGIEPVNEVVAQSYSTKKFLPDVKSIIEMGGEDSKLILIENGKIKEFSMNSVCAAGTGSFLDQQAERLELSIEEFGEVALEAKKPPRIAGRCSVFAKSDMIHLQQIATPMKDIVAGLCFAVARNFKGSICKNIKLPQPISFQGGVAANKGVVRAFKEILGIEQIIIPEHFALMPAIGAVLKNVEHGVRNPYDIRKLGVFISSLGNDGETRHEPLTEVKSEKLKVKTLNLPTRLAAQRAGQAGSQLLTLNSQLPIKAYLGIDIGSISTNLAVIDEQGRLLSKRYLMTAGKPIEAVRKGLEEVGQEIGDKVHIAGVGTTGSGRYMIADFVGADVVKNEITAQAQAAVEIDPEVDTIFEIGGQDSKYISLKDGIIVDFEMNKACAAGTGSFLEEQAEKLDISINEEFSCLAFKSQNPSCLGERCTVFMENSLLAKQQRGIPKEDLVAGLSYSIVQNYINRVVGDKKIGEKIFFQGGVAFNEAVVAAFGKYLNKKIIVPPHHDVTGAIGMAIIAKKHMNDRNELRACLSGPLRREASRQVTSYKSTIENLSPVTRHPSLFKGFDLSRRSYEIKSFECKGCDNLCEINKVQIIGEKEPLFYGSRCEKYDVKRRGEYSSLKMLPDLFAEREAFLTSSHNRYCAAFIARQKKSSPKAKIYIPRIFFFHDYLPFWSTLLWELGFEVEISGNTNRQIINSGIESIHVESCFPHKIAHGHIKDLSGRDADAVLVPSYINFNSGNEAARGFACPYVQTFPYVANVVFRGDGIFSDKIKLLKPVINMELGERYFLREIYSTLRPFSVSMNAIKKAFLKAEKAQMEFASAIKARGKEVLENIEEKAIIITGRSYNAFDPGVNLEIPRKLSDLGILSIPMDYLPLETINITEKWPNMYWRSGQNLLRAGEIIRDHPNLFAIYIGNFSCGPDSFISRYFKESMAGKPFLQIEIDEHSADAGVITRCEAFLDSIMKRKNISAGEPRKVKLVSLSHRNNNRIIYISRMSDHAFGLAAAFEACGLDAEVMPVSDIDTVKIGRRYVSGKECYPFTLTTGDMVKKVLSGDFEPSRAAFFMPSGAGPCRFGQYNILHRLVLNEMGFPHVPIFSPNQDSSFYKELGIVGKDFTKRGWMGIVAIELLIKCLHETRPYEINKGETDAVYNEYLLKTSRMVKSRNSDFDGLLSGMCGDFSRIPRTNGRRPLIGLIGEIFVRHNAFANEDIVRKIEALGGEVWLAPVEEWLYYVNSMALRKALVKWRNSFFSKSHLNDIIKIIITRLVQKNIEHKFSAPFRGFLKTLKEPPTNEIIKNASRYLHKSFEGEAILSIGKTIDFVKKGASGIISTMPFGCMPGTIVSALLKGVKQDTGITCLSIAYDGAETASSEIQLEAFMHQASEYNENKEQVKIIN